MTTIHESLGHSSTISILSSMHDSGKHSVIVWIRDRYNVLFESKISDNVSTFNMFVYEILIILLAGAHMAFFIGFISTFDNELMLITQF